VTAIEPSVEFLPPRCERCSTILESAMQDAGDLVVVAVIHDYDGRPAVFVENEGVMVRYRCSALTRAIIEPGDIVLQPWNEN
jgi:hypothetical protein